MRELCGGAGEFYKGSMEGGIHYEGAGVRSCHVFGPVNSDLAVQSNRKPIESTVVARAYHSGLALPQMVAKGWCLSGYLWEGGCRMCVGEQV